MSFFLLGETFPSSLSCSVFSACSSNLSSSSWSKLGSSSVSCSSTEGLWRHRCSLMLRLDKPSWFSHMADTGRENSADNRKWIITRDEFRELWVLDKSVLPPSKLRESRYLLLVDRSKCGAGRSMRALACLVWACVLPLYRNLEPITMKPLGGGSGDTNL